MFKPLIAILAYVNPEVSEKTLGIGQIYVDALNAAGASPVLLPTTLPNEELTYIFDKMDGLLLSGGCDLAPQLYGTEPKCKIGAIDHERDRADMALFYRAYEKGAPILGICRGCQLINVALGGSLYQDIESEVPGAISHSQESLAFQRHHTIQLTSDSRLLQIFGKQEVQVNSLHHQAIDRLGDGLKITARSSDGIIEAVEGVESERYLHAVQFHPEQMCPHYPEFDDIFAEFVLACQK